MSRSFELVVVAHGVFGVLATLRLHGQPDRKFTLQEALIVARALDAVAQKKSCAREIYMSPIASDHDFEARVFDDGVAVILAGYPNAPLDWTQTLALTREFLRVAGGSPE